MIIVSRIASILLLILGGLVIAIAGFQFLMAMFLVGRGGYFLGLYELGFGFMFLAGGLALWLIADVAQRTKVLYLRSLDDEMGRTRTGPASHLPGPAPWDRPRDR